MPARRKLIPIVLLAALASACGEGGLQMQLDPAQKKCVDTRIQDALAKTTNAGARTQAMSDAFDSAAQACGLSARQKDLYLGYTDVQQGVEPDSIEETRPDKGDAVIRLSDLQRGYVKETSPDGLTVSWFDSSGTSVEKEGQLAVQVRSRRGILAGKDFIRVSDSSRGYAREVYANGTAWVSWYDPASGEKAPPETMVSVDFLSPEVLCAGEICASDRIMRVSDGQKGYAKQVFVAGVARVIWDGNPFWDVVKTSEISRSSR